MIGQQGVKCKNKPLINLLIDIKNKFRKFTIPYNISCSKHEKLSNFNTISALQADATTNEIELSWLIDSQDNYYSIHYMNK